MFSKAKKLALVITGTIIPVLSCWTMGGGACATETVATPIQANAPVPGPELFFANPSVRNLKLSPSGKKMAFTGQRQGEHMALAVMNLEGEPNLHWAGGFSDADVGNFYWVSDDWLVFGASNFQEGSGHESQSMASGLFSARADGSDLRLLVARRDQGLVVDSITPQNYLNWNHAILRVKPNARNEILLGHLELDQKGIFNIEPLWLDVRNGNHRFLDTKNAPDHVLHWYFDTEGEVVGAVRYLDGKSAVFWKTPDGTRWQRLTPDLKDLPFYPLAARNKDSVYVLHASGAGQWQALTVFDLNTLSLASNDLVQVPGFDVEPQLVFDEDTHDLLGIRLETDVDTTAWVNPALKAIQARVDALLPSWVNRVECRNCSQPDRVLVVHSHSAQDPGRDWQYREDSAGKGSLRPIHVSMPQIRPKDMASKSLERIKARDGEDLPVWLVHPHKGQRPNPPPAVVLVHGGPWVRGSHWSWDPTEQFLASLGYLVIVPEFRGSDGYGLRHEEAGYRQWGRAMQNDLVDALRWAQDKGLAGPRACIMGASYGGYATLMGLINDPQVFQCGIDASGVADLELYLKGGWFVDDDISDDGRAYDLPERVGSLPKDSDWLAAVDPVRQANRLKAPLLIAHGVDDMRVPIEHSERLRSALKKSGNDPEWVAYEGEGHGWGRLQTRVDFARRVQGFLARHLPLSPAP